MRGLITESITEDKVWEFLLYQAHRAKRKKGGRLKDDETRIYKNKFDTKYCVALLRRSVTGTTELVENNDIYQLLGYSQLNQYLCACLKISNKQRDAGHSVISTEMIKSERVCILMKMVQSRKVKGDKSTYKENITYTITPYQLAGEI